ncbi:MAG: hypothetical protein EPN91_04900 [Salinibacterium sp.]|nr:MAG: hypothetical protein EPN91_04900 [Salinibacterium sp.]
MIRLGKVGASRNGNADETALPLRLDKLNGVIRTTGIAEYWEAMSRGQVFIASTPVTGVAPGTTAASNLPPFALTNPPNSGVAAILVDAEIAFVSGTLGAGNIILAGAQNQNINPFQLGQIAVGATDAGPKPGLTGLGVRSACWAMNNPLLSVNATLIRPLWSTGQFISNGNLYFGDAHHDSDGYLAVMPGGALCFLNAGGAGTLARVMFSMAWIEVPVAEVNP